MTTYWHGGRRGIPRGAYILPPTVTKAPSLSEYGAAGVHRRDRVYVTTSQAAALLYAAGVNRGVIYECEPVGDVEPDPDCGMVGKNPEIKRSIVPEHGCFATWNSKE